MLSGLSCHLSTCHQEILQLFERAIFYSNNDYQNLDISFIRQILLPYNKVAHNRDVYVMIYVGYMRKIRSTFEYKLIHLSGIGVFDRKT